MLIFHNELECIKKMWILKYIQDDNQFVHSKQKEGLSFFFYNDKIIFSNSISSEL